MPRRATAAAPTSGDDDLFATLDPVRRQLLGWTSSANAWFDHTDDDVPLRSWIEEHVGPDAVTP